MPEFVRDNAGKAFEFMVEKVDEDRKAAGMSTIAEAFAGETGQEMRPRKPNEMLYMNLGSHRNSATIAMLDVDGLGRVYPFVRFPPSYPSLASLACFCLKRNSV